MKKKLDKVFEILNFLQIGADSGRVEKQKTWTAIVIKGVSTAIKTRKLFWKE